MEKIAVSQEESLSGMGPVDSPDWKMVAHRADLSRACMETADTRQCRP